MVTTRGKKLLIENPPSEDDDEGSQPKTLKTSIPKKKKARTLKASDGNYAAGRANPSGPSNSAEPEKKPTRRAGKLRNLMEMPVDVFANICICLSPRDLRSFSLATKRLRAIMISRDFKPVWRDCIAAVPGLPECPPDLNEMQYVRLMFSADCFACDSRGTLVDFYHRRRYCAGCYDANIVSYGEASNIPKGDHSLVRYASSQDVPSEARETRDRKRRSCVVFKLAYRNILAEYDLTSGESDVTAARSAFTAKWDARRKMLTETGKAMYTFKKGLTSERADELETLKNAHQASVEAKLFDLGWEKNDIPTRNKSYNSLVRKSKQLTEKAWISLYPQIEPILEKTREDRLALEKNRRHWKRRSSLAEFYEKLAMESVQQNPVYGSRSCPGLNDFNAWPKVAALLEADTEDVTEEMWMTIVDDVREWVLQYHQSILQALADILDGKKVDRTFKADDELEDKSKFARSKRRAEGDGVGAGAPTHPTVYSPNVVGTLTEKLSLTTSAFFCAPCETIHWYPDVLSHLRYSHSESFGSLQAATEKHQSLITRMMKDIGIESSTYKFADLDNQRTMICRRCDERIASYYTFPSMVTHYLLVARWHSKAEAFIKKGYKAAYPSHSGKKDELPEIYNDHDWTLDTPLIRSDEDRERRKEVEALQNAFKTQCRRDPADDKDGAGGDTFQYGYWNRFKKGRKCKLCPTGFSPSNAYISAGDLRIHIEAKHRKTPDLENDTYFNQSERPSNPCPLS